MLILTTKLGVGGGQRESAWQELPDGSWSMEVEQGGAFGEAALLKGLVRHYVKGGAAAYSVTCCSMQWHPKSSNQYSCRARATSYHVLHWWAVFAAYRLLNPL